MIRGSIGYGYHYTHLTKGTDIHGFPLTKAVCDSATDVRSVKIYYGGQTGTAERINIEVKTATMELKFNISLIKKHCLVLRRVDTKTDGKRNSTKTLRAYRR